MRSYLEKFDELNMLYYEMMLVSENFKNKKDAKEKFDDCLIDFFIDGFSSGLLEFGDKKDLPNPYDFLNVYYDSKSIDDIFDEHFANHDEKGLRVLLESESHRMWNTGLFQVGGETKIWRTEQDDKVRDLHWFLDGTELPYDEEFITFNGDSGLFPGGFKLAQNNANCRCWLEIKR